MPLFRYGSQPLADYKYQNLACKLQYTNSLHVLVGTLISRCQLWNDVTKHRTACNVYTARTALRVDVTDVSPLRQFSPSLIRRFLLIFLLIQLKPKHHHLDVLNISARCTRCTRCTQCGISWHPTDFPVRNFGLFSTVTSPQRQLARPTRPRCGKLWCAQPEPTRPTETKSKQCNDNVQ